VNTKLLDDDYDDDTGQFPGFLEKACGIPKISLEELPQQYF